jgi:hypothetical protein
MSNFWIKELNISNGYNLCEDRIRIDAKYNPDLNELKAFLANLEEKYNSKIKMEKNLEEIWKKYNLEIKIEIESLSNINKIEEITQVLETIEFDSKEYSYLLKQFWISKIVINNHYQYIEWNILYINNTYIIDFLKEKLMELKTKELDLI